MTPVELARDFLGNQPSFIVEDHCQKNYSEQYKTSHTADLMGVIYVLESLETIDDEHGSAI
jgi:hypothetical protein